jgi:gliding motility-associated protein GldC
MAEKTSEIRITVNLDEQYMPQKINWLATDSDMQEPAACKAFLLSLWDEKQEETLRIDLWTKDMRQDEMDTFYFQTFMTMADTYMRSNQQEEVVEFIKDFAFRFGEKTGLLKKKE